MYRSPIAKVIMIILFLTLIMAGYVFLMDRIIAPPAAPQAGLHEPAAIPRQSALQSAIPDPAPAPSGQPAKAEDVRRQAGSYVGRIDNNFIEIKVGDETKVFLFPEGATGIVLNEGDAVSFEVYKDDNGRTAISSILKLLPE